MKLIRVVIEIWRCAPWREALAATLYGAWMIAGLPWNRARPGVPEARLAKCRNGCPVYDAQHDSCGAPGHMVDGRPFGCWCYLPLAARRQDKECWAGCNGMEDRWTSIS